MLGGSNNLIAWPSEQNCQRQNYMSTISQLHQAEMKDLLMSFMATVNAASGEERNEACRFCDCYYSDG